MSERGYSVKIIDASKDLTPTETVMMKDTGDAIRLDSATQDEEFILIDVDFYVALQVHNEQSENKDYDVFILVDKSGNKFVTGSDSFWDSFMDIYNELHDVPGWKLKVYRLPSKKRTDKYFLTCSISVS